MSFIERANIFIDRSRAVGLSAIARAVGYVFNANPQMTSDEIEDVAARYMRGDAPIYDYERAVREQKKWAHREIVFASLGLPLQLGKP